MLSCTTYLDHMLAMRPAMSPFINCYQISTVHSYSCTFNCLTNMNSLLPLCQCTSDLFHKPIKPIRFAMIKRTVIFCGPV